MENWESIALTISFILLVVSIGLSPLMPTTNTTTVFTLICMVLVAHTTFLDTLSQQKHTIPGKFKKLHIGISIALVIALILAKVFGAMLLVQYVVVGFLILSIVGSMVIIRQTKPIKQFQHLEKSNRIFSITFLILVPVYLIFHYGFNNEYEQFKIGILLYFAFIALAVRKIYDDLQRLSIINSQFNPQEQKLQNYGLTNREQEIAELLYEGLTYQKISDTLHISLPTVKTHTSNIYKKCRVKSRNELSRLLSN